jgi:hypothetical protein
LVSKFIDAINHNLFISRTKSPNAEYHFSIPCNGFFKPIKAILKKVTMFRRLYKTAPKNLQNNPSIIFSKTSKHHDPYVQQCPSLYLPTVNCSTRALISARVRHRVMYGYDALG